MNDDVITRVFEEDEDIINDLPVTDQIVEPDEDPTIPREDEDTGEGGTAGDEDVSEGNAVAPDVEDVINDDVSEDLSQGQTTAEEQERVPIISNIETLPTIGNVSAGDRVMIALVNGQATVVGVVGSGDRMNDRVTEVQAVAGDINQYFWHTTTGTDTGAHITQIPQQEFILNPAGGNTLIRSNGIAIRDGLTQLARFTGSGVQVGQDAQSRLVQDYHSLQLVDKEGTTYFHVADLRDSTGWTSIIEETHGTGEIIKRTIDGVDYWQIQVGKEPSMDTQHPINLTVASTVINNVQIGGSSSYTIIFPVTEMPTIPTLTSFTVTYYSQSTRAKAFTFGVRSGRIGTLSSTLGYNCNAIGRQAVAVGESTTASGRNAFAEGYNSYARGLASHAEGYRTEANSTYSHAEGQSTEASGVAAHTEGQHTTASNMAAHAEGYGSTASNYNSHAEGYMTDSTGNSSHAEGYSTTASAIGSHAEGQNTTASGNEAHAEGLQTTASGLASHAGGIGTIANGSAQTVLGKYNVADTTSLLIVGNGTDDNNRSNALILDASGNLYVSGGIGGSNEFKIGDTATIHTYFGAGIFTNSKKDIRISFPVGKPIAADVTGGSVSVNVNRAWQNGNTIVSAVTSAGSSEIQSISNECGIVSLYVRNNGYTAWSSSGTNNDTIAVQLTGINITFS